MKILIEIFCQKPIVSNVISTFLDHLKPKIFFAGQPERHPFPKSLDPPLQWQHNSILKNSTKLVLRIAWRHATSSRPNQKPEEHFQNQMWSLTLTEKSFFIFRMLWKRFLRVFLYKQLIQGKFHCVIIIRQLINGLYIVYWK